MYFCIKQQFRIWVCYSNSEMWRCWVTGCLHHQCWHSRKKVAVTWWMLLKKKKKVWRRIKCCVLCWAKKVFGLKCPKGWEGPFWFLELVVCYGVEPKDEILYPTLASARHYKPLKSYWSLVLSILTLVERESISQPMETQWPWSSLK